MERNFLGLLQIVNIQTYSYGVRTVRRKSDLINRAIEPSVLRDIWLIFNRIVGD